jgi:biopolymer transport protein ExbD
MAVKIKRTSKSQDEMSMSSISDIVFLLLIYFMVVTVFQQDIGMPFALPSAQDNQDDSVKVKESDVTNIDIDANNVITVNRRPMRVNALKKELSRQLTENPKLIVMLNNHPKSDYGTFAAVLDEIRLAKCRKVSIKMQEQ